MHINVESLDASKDSRCFDTLRQEMYAQISASQHIRQRHTLCRSYHNARFWIVLCMGGRVFNRVHDKPSLAAPARQAARSLGLI